MDDELDLVVFEDDQGNEITMEVLDYLFYEGTEYAVLAEYHEGADEDEQREVAVMEVRPVKDDEENEEFVPIEDALAERLFELYQTNYDEDEVFEDDEEEEE